MSVVGEDATTDPRSSLPDPELDRPDHADDPREAGGMGAPPSPPVRILLVDDDEVDRMAARRVLRDTGLDADVREVRSVEEARDALRSEPFDCALVDYWLPDGEGVDVLRVAVEEQVVVPVIMLTGQGDEDLAVDLMKEGARDYIPKNALTPGRLAQSIRYILDVTRAEREARRTREGQRFLAEASQQLAQSLDYDATVERVAHLVVPRMADHCFVDVRMSDGGLERAAAAHREDAEDDFPFPPDPRRDSPVRGVLETGEPLLLEDVSQEVMEAAYPDGDVPESVGRKLPISLLVAPLLARGRTLGSLSLVAAESGRRYDEHDLVVAQNLANRAALAMDNARLYEKARQAVAARDEMLGVVSHDLRNPLNVIGAAAGLILDIPLPEEKKQEQLRTIKKSADRMNRLIQDLLDVTGIEAGRFSVERTPEDPEELLEEAYEMMVPLFSDGDVSLDREPLPCPLPGVYADRERILQVFSNLLGNALKFTPEGGRVSLGAAPADDGLVRFFVEDTGHGIPEEDLPHLFDRFWSGHRSGDAREGTGLGLPIARGIVEVHGGAISVESEPGVGTRISFTIPTTRAADSTS